MADKDDLRQLASDVRNLGDQVRDLSGQVSAVLQKHESLAERAKGLELFREKTQPNIWFLNGARGFLITLWLGIGAVLLTGIGATVSGAFWLGSLSSDVKHHDADLAALKKEIDGLRDDLKQVPRVQEGKVAKTTRDRITIQMLDGTERIIPFTVDVEVTQDGKHVPATDLEKGGLATITEIDGQAVKIDVRRKTP